MPDRPTPSDVDGSDLKVSDLKVSGAEAPEPVGSGEVNGGGAGPVAPDAAPSPSAPADQPTLDRSAAPQAEEPGPADSWVPAAQQPGPPVVPPASEVDPTEVIPRNDQIGRAHV